LDPLGNQAATSECTMEVAADAITYRWAHDGKSHAGTLALRATGADFTDSFHAEQPLPLEAVAGSWALVDVQGTYPAGDGPPWGWRIMVSHRPTDELVLQMTNITPWGEDGRAVRMVCKRA
ncbi:MAG: hypothetical protein H0T79_17315, partial [Deltaproteobacteria bacterium]|nr:hypothetical protein [Deltaproteobacteria bacterium]